MCVLSDLSHYISFNGQTHKTHKNAGGDWHGRLREIQREQHFYHAFLGHNIKTCTLITSLKNMMILRVHVHDVRDAIFAVVFIEVFLVIWSLVCSVQWGTWANILFEYSSWAMQRSLFIGSLSFRVQACQAPCLVWRLATRPILSLAHT